MHKNNHKYPQIMHKNTKFTNTNTHKYPMLKLKMQAERDIPCERETKSMSNRARGRPRAWATEQEGDWATERDREGDWKGDWERVGEFDSEIEKVRESWEGDWKSEREIERVSDERVAMGMKFISWVSENWERKFWYCYKRSCQYRMVPELDGLGYHAQYLSPQSSSTKGPIF